MPFSNHAVSAGVESIPQIAPEPSVQAVTKTAELHDRTIGRAARSFVGDGRVKVLQSIVVRRGIRCTSSFDGAICLISNFNMAS